MTSTIELQGPALIPASPTAAVVLLHGFGSDGDDLIQLAPHLDRALPAHLQRHVAYLAPHGVAPTPFNQGYQWFSDSNWTFLDRAGIGRASDAIEHFVAAQVVNELAVPWDKIIIVGFSQGAMTGLYASPRWQHTLAGLVAHSGVAMWQEELDKNTCKKPPVLLIHGQDDDVVVADQSVKAEAGLKNLGFETHLHILDELGHGFDARSIGLTAAFMAEVLK
ncbi:MAG: alpha/beta fold hydrolase [Alphaproteobacteria bacterium]